MQLQLSLQVVHAANRHLCLLHQLQERRLYATSTDVTANQVAGRRDLIDLVDINNAELRAVHVAIRLVHQFPNQIFHITANVTGLTELRRVGFNQRQFDQIGDVLDQIRLPRRRSVRPK